MWPCQTRREGYLSSPSPSFQVSLRRTQASSTRSTPLPSAPRRRCTAGRGTRPRRVRPASGTFSRRRPGLQHARQRENARIADGVLRCPFAGRLAVHAPRDLHQRVRGIDALDEHAAGPQQHLDRARHALLPIDAPLLALGAFADGDANGSPSASATGDDNQTLLLPTTSVPGIQIGSRGPASLSVPSPSPAPLTRCSSVLRQ